MKNFILIGSAGYIAQRHFKAIQETSNNLLASFDINDSVGVMDSYFPDSEFFTNFEELNEFILDMKQGNNPIDYLVVCSPNYLHKAHIKFALNHNINVICEKPIVLNSKDINDLAKHEAVSKAKINCILQLRLHSKILQLRDQIKNSDSKNHTIDLQYITSRGKWYNASWKGDETKSGGLAANIGVHFFDMLSFIFGNTLETEVSHKNNKSISGTTILEKAQVNWKLSIDASELPAEVAETGQRTYRSIKLNNEEIEFSQGFTDLHTKSYQEILIGNGFSISDCSQAIATTEFIRLHSNTTL